MKKKIALGIVVLGLLSVAGLFFASVLVDEEDYAKRGRRMPGDYFAGDRYASEL